MLRVTAKDAKLLSVGFDNLDKIILSILKESHKGYNDLFYSGVTDSDAEILESLGYTVEPVSFGANISW